MRSALKAVFKHALIIFLKCLGLLRLARWFTTRNSFVIIGWHGVSIDAEHERFKTLFISTETLERRLKFLKKVFNIVSLEAALSQQKSKSIRPAQAVLTFDDGYYNFLSKAVPLLSRYQAPAVCYIVTEPMVNEESKPNLLLRDCITRTKLTEVELQEPGLNAIVPLRSQSDKARAEVQLLNALAAISKDQRNAFVDRLGDAMGIDVASLRASRYWNTMTAGEVRELVESSDLFSIQLHTHVHINVIALGDQLDSDLRLCRAEVEKATGRDATDFCYPTGFWSKNTWPVLADNGIRSAVTTRRGPNYVETHPFCLRRVMDGEATSQLEFELEVSGLKWLLRSWFHCEKRWNPSEKHSRYRDRQTRAENKQ
ncbi:MAG: polysaccharide deacetylase family protein [Rubripirellula sp.]